MAGIAKMQAATTELAAKTSASMTKNKAVWDGAAKGMMVGGLALGAVLVGAAKAFMEFDAAMSGVAAVSNATAKEQAALGKAAIQAGQDTVFSATEAANAEAELAKAGVSVADIMGGGLRGSLDLAAAGQIDLAKAAEISAQAMNIFSLEGKDVGHIADVLTAGANKSAAGVDDLGMALQQGGLVAKQTGLTLEETVGTLSAFADYSLKSSDAGTSLKTMLQRLTPQSAEAQAQFDKLGISAYDASGNFVGLANFAGQLQTKMADLTPEARNSALAVMFGSDAVRGANVLYEQGAAGMQTYIKAVNDQGAAQRMAARMTDNLKGDGEQLKGTLESAFINAGSGGNDGLRSLTQGITNLINGFNTLSPGVQGAVTKITAATGAVLLLGGASIKAATSIAAMRVSMEAAGISGGKLTRSLKAAGAAAIVIGGITIAGSAMQDMWQGLSGATDDQTRSLAAFVAGGKDAKFVTDDMGYGLTNLADVVNQGMNHGFLNNVGEFFGELGTVGGIFGPTRRDDAESFFRTIDQGLAGLAKTNPQAAAEQFSRIAKEFQAQGYSLDQVREKLPEYAAFLDTATVSATGAAAAGGEFADQTYDAAKAAQDAADGTKTWADELAAINNPRLDARDAARQFEQSIADANAALEANGKTLDIHTEKGRKNQAALDDVAKAAIDNATAMQANGASQSALNSVMTTSRARLIAVAEKFGMSKGAAKAYADQVLKTPTSVTTTITAKTAAAKTAVANFQNQINRLRGNTVTIGVRYVTTGRLPNGGVSTAGGITKAGGGSVYGEGTGTSDSIPARLSNGEHVLTASDVAKAGGQGAIYRMRSAIQSGLLRFSGGGAVPAKFADGGAVDWSDIMSIIGDVTVWDDVAKARTSASSAAAGVKSSRASLLSMRAAVNAANAAVAKARRTRGTADDHAALDKRAVALARLAAAEAKYAGAVSKSGAAAKAALDAVHKYDADRKPLIDRALTASGAANTHTKAFLDNIDKLTRMGFKTLAMYLLDQGGPEAETLAAQAVASASKAKALQANLASSAALAAREAATKAALGGDGAAMSDPAALGWYSAVRDLGPASRPTPAGVGGVGQRISVSIAGALDPVGVGAQVEKVLQKYVSVSGRPLQVSTL
jgi:TP901 family phage tail tape measure protein